ncbi:MAG: GAF domain-containing protein, partial [Treponema sp.]|nr:GAF domain-containing protein [Treponema sp.]
MKQKKNSWLKAVFVKFLFSDELPLEARLLNTIYLVGLMAALLTLITRILTGNNIYIIIIISSIFVFVLVIMSMSNYLRQYSVFRWIIITLVCDVFFPIAFFVLGGIKSSIMGYFILSIVLVFYLTWGKSRVIFLFIHLCLVILAYYLSSLPFFSRFLLDNSRINLYVDQILTIIVVGLCIGFMMLFQSRIYIIEKAKADSAGEELEQRNRLLEVVNKTAEMLLSSDAQDLQKVLHSAMDLMARCVDVDRMYIWRTRIIDGKFRYEQEYEWVSPPVADMSLRIKTGQTTHEVIPLWDAYFSAGRYINGPVSSLSEAEQEDLSRFGIRSILAIPVFLQKKFWGFVSFDDCRRERIFSGDEINILRSGSLLLANAIVRNNNTIMIDARMKQQEIMSVISRSFISKEPIDTLIKAALRRVGEFMGVTRTLVMVPDLESDETR